MRRRVIQLAVKTLVVSLPTEWTQRHRIEKGSEVDVREREDSIVVTSSKQEKNKLSILLDIKKDDYFNKRFISDLYKRGYDRIKINFRDKEVLDEVKKVDLLGFQIIEEEENYCVIENISKVLGSEFDTILKRVFHIIKDMINRLIGYFKGEDVNLDEIINMEKETNKLTDFCLRVLNKEGHSSKNKTNFYYVIVRELEDLADIMKYIIHDVREENIEIPDEVLKYFEKVQNVFNEFYSLFYKYERERFNEFYSKRHDMIDEGKELLKKEYVVSHHLLNLIKRVYNLSGPYLTMNFEKICLETD